MGLSPHIKFSIFKKTNTIQAGGKKCNLCLCEKQAIIEHRSNNLLNERIEIYKSCNHRLKWKLINIS